MSAPAVSSALDVANWFFKQAEKDGWYLENEKLQHLLFLAQVHYALLNAQNYLMPAVFVVDASGFTEPNVKKALSFGRPLMTAPQFSRDINHFLSLIWQKYSPMSIRDLADFVKSSALYGNNFQIGHANLVNPTELSAQFKENLTSSTLHRTDGRSPSKVLISQHGPVVVSSWKPRKLNSQNTKENTNV